MFVIYDSSDDCYVGKEGDNQWTVRLQKARLYVSINEARKYIKEYNLTNCTWVKVRINGTTGEINLL